MFTLSLTPNLTFDLSILSNEHTLFVTSITLNPWTNRVPGLNTA
jgi:hypothetical protein